MLEGTVQLPCIDLEDYWNNLDDYQRSDCVEEYIKNAEDEELKNCVYTLIDGKSIDDIQDLLEPFGYKVTLIDENNRE